MNEEANKPSQFLPPTWLIREFAEKMSRGLTIPLPPTPRRRFRRVRRLVKRTRLSLAKWIAGYDFEEGYFD